SLSYAKTGLSFRPERVARSRGILMPVAGGADGWWGEISPLRSQAPSSRDDRLCLSFRPECVARSRGISVPVAGGVAGCGERFLHCGRKLPPVEMTRFIYQSGRRFLPVEMTELRVGG